MSSLVTAGNTLAVAIGWFTTAPGDTSALASVTDTLGNSFTLVPSSFALETGVVGYGNGNFYSEIAYATQSLAGPDSITATLTIATTFSLLYVVETTPSTLDVASGGNGSSPSPNAGTVTIASNGEFALAMTDMDQSVSTAGGPLLPGSGWTVDRRHRALRPGGSVPHSRGTAHRRLRWRRRRRPVDVLDGRVQVITSSRTCGVIR